MGNVVIQYRKLFLKCLIITQRRKPVHRSRLMTLAAVMWIGMIAALLFSDINTIAAQTPQAAQTALAAPKVEAQPKEQAILLPARVDNIAPAAKAAAPVTAQPGAPDVVVAPYSEYVVTQGLHGYSYGHAAIDLTGGNGAAILSPINGSVTQNFVDYLGNTTLVIENDYYQVTLMHGLYTAAVGQVLSAGQVIGSESNQGNTVDWWGQSCRGRDCGYHTHLNIFDKRIGSNTNPLGLMP